MDTCYGTHHPQFGYDANDTLWTSGGGPVVGWLNTKLFLETGDAATFFTAPKTADARRFIAGELLV